MYKIDILDRVHIAHAVLMPTGSEAIYQFWIIFVVGLILLFVGNALVQYPRTVMWKILGEWVSKKIII